jgi:regulator of replication initiation timing
MGDMTAQCTLFMDQIESVTSGDVPDMYARIDDLVDENDAHRMDIEELRRKFDILEEKSADMEEMTAMEKENMQVEKEKAEKYLGSLKGLIDGMALLTWSTHSTHFALKTDMKALQATTEREIEVELDTLRQLREAIEREVSISSITSFEVLTDIVQQNALSPRKRKRDADDEGDRENESVDSTTHFHDEMAEIHDVAPPQRNTCGVEFEIQHHIDNKPSPRKRARRFVSVAAKTVTAVTMGAAAAWVALAFS